MVLQRANHLQAGAVPDMRQAGVAMAAEVSLQDSPILGAIEHRAPGFQFAHALGRFLGMKLSHAPVVHVLPAAHRIGEMHFPIVALIHVRQGRGDSSFCHDGVGLAQERFADQAHRNSRRRRFNRRPQSRAAGAHDQNVILVSGVLGH
jgi:hypothetical protein